MRPVKDALDVLQADVHVGMGYLLPTLSVLRNKLTSLKNYTSITFCQ
jgi:hypothetical protein